MDQRNRHAITAIAAAQTQRVEVVLRQLAALSVVVVLVLIITLTGSGSV